MQGDYLRKSRANSCLFAGETTYILQAIEMDSIFVRVAKNPKAFPEAAKTVRRLKEIAVPYWDKKLAGISDEKAFSILLQKEWMSLQRIRDDEEPLTDISPLADFPQITGLCLWNNVIEDISQLSGLRRLKRLGLYRNKITDIGPIRGMANLRDLGSMHLTKQPDYANFNA